MPLLCLSHIVRNVKDLLHSTLYTVRGQSPNWRSVILVEIAMDPDLKVSKLIVSNIVSWDLFNRRIIIISQFSCEETAQEAQILSKQFQSHRLFT